MSIVNVACTSEHDDVKWIALSPLAELPVLLEGNNQWNISHYRYSMSQSQCLLWPAVEEWQSLRAICQLLELCPPNPSAELPQNRLLPLIVLCLQQNTRSLLHWEETIQCAAYTVKIQFVMWVSLANKTDSGEAKVIKFVSALFSVALTYLLCLTFCLNTEGVKLSAEWFCSGMMERRMLLQPGLFTKIIHVSCGHKSWCHSVSFFTGRFSRNQSLWFSPRSGSFLFVLECCKRQGFWTSLHSSMPLALQPSEGLLTAVTKNRKSRHMVQLPFWIFHCLVSKKHEGVWTSHHRSCPLLRSPLGVCWWLWPKTAYLGHMVWAPSWIWQKTPFGPSYAHLFIDVHHFRICWRV